MSELVEQHATTADTGEQRKTPVIDPTNVREQVKGLCWFEWQVRLPQGTTFQDLNDPTIWRLVQLNKNTALSRLDRVRIIPYDEAWIAEAVVASATQFGVSLTKPVKIDLPVRDQVLFEDDLYRIEWRGTGYSPIRKRDGHQMSEPVASAKWRRETCEIFIQASRGDWNKWPGKSRPR